MYLVSIVVLAAAAVAGSTLVGYSYNYEPRFYTPAPAQTTYNPQHDYYTDNPVIYYLPRPIPQPQFQGFQFSPAPLIYKQQTVQVNAEHNSGQSQPQAPEESGNDVVTEPDNFRGYAYHTEYDDGARSNVVFITGPEIHKFNEQSKTEQTKNEESKNDHTSASDSVDSIATEAADQNPSVQALANYLNNPQVGIFRFYSVNNELVARNLNDDIPQYPANVQAAVRSSVLQHPISPIIPLLRASFSLDKDEKTTEKPEDKKTEKLEDEKTEKPKEEPESAASEIKSKTVAPQTTVAETTAATTEEATTTTTVSPTTSSTTMEPIVVEDTSSTTKKQA